MNNTIEVIYRDEYNEIQIATIEDTEQLPECATDVVLSF